MRSGGERFRLLGNDGVVHDLSVPAGDEADPRTAAALGAWIRTLHDRGIFHDDLHRGNCLLSLPEGETFIAAGSDVTCIRLDMEEGTA